MKKESVLIFDDTVKERLIESLGYKREGSKIKDRSGKIVTSLDYEPVTYKEFGGFLKGLKRPIRKRESDLVKYFVSVKNQDDFKIEDKKIQR